MDCSLLAHQPAPHQPPVDYQPNTLFKLCKTKVQNGWHNQILNEVRTLHQLRSQRTSHLPLGNLKRSFTSFSVRLPKSLTNLSYDTEDSKYHTDSAAFNPTIDGNENQIRRLSKDRPGRWTKTIKSSKASRFYVTDDRFSVVSDPTNGGPIIPKSFKDSQIVLSESDGVSKIVDPKDSSQRHTIALLVNEKSVLNDQLESYRKRVEDLNHDIEKHQNALKFQMNFSNKELENSRTSINNLNSQLLDSNNLITALRQELDRKRSELQDLNQSQSNGTEEVLRMKQNHSDAVESELSCLRDLIKSQDDESREQAGRWTNSIESQGSKLYLALLPA
ncbi:hypothetical protein BY996DRAFT_8458993 [Phakopsora pachyrhizi]|nr:hypothetical protein BY996DRAFT_8458993 [Phakopsora pachyrhizi]